MSIIACFAPFWLAVRVLETAAQLRVRSGTGLELELDLQDGVLTFSEQVSAFRSLPNLRLEEIESGLIVLCLGCVSFLLARFCQLLDLQTDRKSTRLNSSHRT